MNRWWIATCPALFLSFAGVVVIFSTFSAFAVALSVEEGFRAGGLGLRAADSCLMGVWLFAVDWEFILLSDLIASFVENIRVSRFVIEGFSGGGDIRVDLRGSEGGAACPLPLRLSVLGTAIPFCLTGYDSGDPTADDVCEGAGEG